jgi:serine/threonine protein kinase
MEIDKPEELKKLPFSKYLKNIIIDYEILELIGTGSFGTVFLAKNKSNEQKVNEITKE